MRRPASAANHEAQADPRFGACRARRAGRPPSLPGVDTRRPGSWRAAAALLGPVLVNHAPLKTQGGRRLVEKQTPSICGIASPPGDTAAPRLKLRRARQLEPPEHLVSLLSSRRV
ncbi:hypothetical protein MRX96_047243 [Rhipicephalus microplus]